MGFLRSKLKAIKCRNLFRKLSFLIVHFAYLLFSLSLLVKSENYLKPVVNSKLLRSVTSKNYLSETEVTGFVIGNSINMHIELLCVFTTILSGISVN